MHFLLQRHQPRLLRMHVRRRELTTSGARSTTCYGERRQGVRDLGGYGTPVTLRWFSYVSKEGRGPEGGFGCWGRLTTPALTCRLAGNERGGVSLGSGLGPVPVSVLGTMTGTLTQPTCHYKQRNVWGRGDPFLFPWSRTSRRLTQDNGKGSCTTGRVPRGGPL